MNIAIDVCLGAMLLFGFFSVLSRHLINAAISLAAVSAACGVLMYVLGAHTAAIFEVSVCSGLVTVIFISAVSLSNGDRQASAPEKRAHLLPIILIAIGAVLVIVSLLTGFSLGTRGPVGSAAKSSPTTSSRPKTLIKLLFIDSPPLQMNDCSLV